MEQKSILALGFFDGVHLGHQALLQACRELAAENGCHAGALTFIGHPDGLVQGNAPALLNTDADRKALLCAYGMDRVLELPFDRTLMTTHWSDFLQQLVDGGAVGFVCGSDFRFGANGNGTAKRLEAFCQQRGLSCGIVPQQMLDGIRISATAIRGLLQEGRLAQANRLLGHPHILTGQVVSGKQLGRTIGFPTANLHLPAGLLVPKCGVYACKVWIEGKVYPAVTNIGTRPTVGGEGVTVEAFLLDFDGDLYGKSIRVAFHEFLRPEKKFADLPALQEEIMENVRQTRNFFKKSE